MEGKDMEKLLLMLENMDRNDEEQKLYMKKQQKLQMIRTITNLVLAGVIIICLAIVVPTTLRTVKKLDSAVTQMEVVMGNLEEFSTELAEADLSGMLESVNILVEDSQDSLGVALEKVEAIDIETLNGAIADLKTVVEPMAKLFGR